MAIQNDLTWLNHAMEFRAPDLGPICMRSCLASPQAAAFLQTCKSERNGHLCGKDLKQINLGISRNNSESKGPEMTRKSVRILELALLGLGIPSIMQMAQGAWCHRRCASSAAAARQATSPWGTMEHRYMVTELREQHLTTQPLCQESAASHPTTAEYSWTMQFHNSTENAANPMH